MGEHGEDHGVISKSLVALRRIIKYSVTETDNPEAAIARQICDAGRSDKSNRGVAILVEAMQQHSYDDLIVKETALLLTSLSRNPDVIPVLMTVAVQPCMKAMELHQNEVGVADALSGLLAKLPLEDDARFVEGMT